MLPEQRKKVQVVLADPGAGGGGPNEPPKALRDYMAILRKRRWLVTGCVATVVALVMYMTSRQEPRYEATANIMIDGRDRGLVELEGAANRRPTFTDADLLTEIKFIRSWPLLEEAAKRSGVDVSNGVPVEVNGGKQDWVVTITAASNQPEEARNLANSVAQVYVERNLSRNRRKARTAREFLGGQEEKLRQSLENASRALRDYETQTGSAILASATESRVRVLTEAESRRNAAVADQQAAKSRADQLRTALKNTDAEIVSSTSITRNPAIDKLQDTIATLSQERAALLREYQPASSKVQEVETRLAHAQEKQKALVQDIMSSRQVAVNPAHQQLMSQLMDAESQSLTAAAQIAGLTRAIDQQNAALRTLPQRQYRLAQLQRNVSAAERAYLAVRERHQQMRIAEESTLADAEIIEPAVLPQSPVSPKPVFNFVVAMVAGLILGVGIAAVRESLDDTVQTVDDVERDLAVPLLGVVGAFPRHEDRMLQARQPVGGIAEAFRVIRANMKLITVNEDLRTLMVTSTLQGEGKSTTAVNLAVALAQIGRRVLLVDSDLRNPSLDRLLGLTPGVGFGDVLTGTATVEEAVRQTSIPNVSVVTAGSMPLDAIELLESPEFATLVERLKSEAEVVIFDVPPVLGLADASVIAPHIDGIILVIASGEVERQALRRTVDTLKMSRARVVGAALNKVNLRDSAYYSGYYKDYRPSASNGSAGRKGIRGKLPRLGGRR